MKNDETIEYYRKRAEEYDNIYYKDDPVRQGELAELYNMSRKVLAGRTVLDIACGTGFWTREVSETAQSIIGLDINEATLAVARHKTYACPTEFLCRNIFAPGEFEPKPDGLLATFLISHVKRQEIETLRDRIKSTIVSGSPAFLCDNNLICEMIPDLIPDEDSVNTYKKRKLENGKEYTILKNYFEPEELKAIFSSWGKITAFYFEKYYWAIALEIS